MIIDVKKLKSKGITDYNFEFDYIPPENLITLPETVFTKAVKVAGELSIYNDYILVEADIDFEISGDCSRCLEKAVLAVKAKLDEKFLNVKSDTEYYYLNEMLDLSSAVNDLIIMNMPYIILCKEDCKGLCSKCGANLNKQECKCENR